MHHLTATYAYHWRFYGLFCVRRGQRAYLLEIQPWLTRARLCALGNAHTLYHVDPARPCDVATVLGVAVTGVTQDEILISILALQTAQRPRNRRRRSGSCQNPAWDWRFL